MSTPILATKLYRPPPRPSVVRRPRLLQRLNEGLDHPLTLISAPAGFGKTTLISDWLAEASQSAVWLSLDEADADPIRFLSYLVAAVQTRAPRLGAGVMAALSSPQPPCIEALLTALLNDLTSVADPFLLVLDDYHTCAGPAVDAAVSFLLQHLPPQIHLLLATRADPHLPLARLRGRGHLLELRAADLRCTPEEAADFLGQVMGLTLSTEEIAALQERTEGWIAGLQLAGLWLQGQPDAGRVIAAFTGSHHFVLDYLAEEVLTGQPAPIQRFLLQTSILDRLCGPLCDAVLHAAAGRGQRTLEALERANLFVIPLDPERGWYRYHHLFAELLRQRLQQSLAGGWAGGDEETAAGEETAGREDGEAVASLAELHVRASAWLEGQGLGLEAFQHAAAAHDIDRATRLLESKGIPRQFRGTVKAILDWLGSLPASELDSRPGLQTMYASVLLATGQTTGIEEKLQAAETALHGAELDDSTRDLVGQIAAIRATLAIAEYQVDMMLAQSQRALEYLSPRSLFLRATAYWTMGVAYNLQGDRPAARQAYTEAIAISRASGDIFATILATVSLGAIQEADNQLYQAAETYRRVLELAGDMPLPIAGEAHLGLAHIHYEWNELEAALTHGQQSLTLSRQYESIIDRWVLCEVFLARLKLAHGDLAGAAAQLAQAEQAARQQHFVYRLPEIAAAQLVTWLQQGQVEAAAQLAQTYDLPLCQARVSLAQGDPAAAWIKLSAWGAKVEARGWADEQLRVRVLQALAYQAQGEQEQAVSELSAALALAEPGGYIRIFVDEGAAMQRLLSAVAAVGGRMPDYIGRILAGFEAHTPQTTTPAYPPAPTAQRLIDPLSPRELEVLHLIAQGRSDQEIAGQLFIALSTVKGHNRKIFGKLQVQRRTEAVARARDLGLL